jgi:hypothetical protein
MAAILPMTERMRTALDLRRPLDRSEPMPVQLPSRPGVGGFPSTFDQPTEAPVELNPPFQVEQPAINTSHPWLQTLATSPLNNGSQCVPTVLGNMDRLGVPSFKGGTLRDPNNSRGAMVQMITNGKWTSLPLPGSELRTIKSPYGTVQAHVLNADAYESMAKRGEIPSGAILFQTRHGWNYGGGPYGNDMGIVRDGGRYTHNYKQMNPIIYGDAKEVVVLVPS